MLFATVGAVPLLAAFLVRARFVQDWAAQETARILEQEIGTRASYAVRVTPWPLTVAITDLEIEGDDGQGPFLTVERASVTPRMFSLLAGRLDVGDVEITGAHARVVVRDGKLLSFQPDLPPSDPSSEQPEELPFRSLSLTDTSLDLDIDGVVLALRETDVDLSGEEGGAFELAARAGSGLVTRVHTDPSHPKEDMADEDRLCRFEVRARIDPASRDLRVRRLALDGSVDLDPAPGTRPPCELAEDDWRRLSVRVGALRLPEQLLSGEGLELLSGRVGLRLPVALIHRFLPFAHVSGMVELEVEATRAPLEKFPLVTGRVRGEHLGLDSKVFSDRFEGQLRFDGATATVTDLEARWSDGDFKIKTAALSITDPKLPLSASGIVADGVELQGLLRDLGVHPQSHVGWGIGHVDIPAFGGTLNPLTIEGKLTAKTSRFGIYDRPSHRPDKQRMISLDRADVTGTLAIRPDAVYLEGMHVLTAGSNIRATVKLGFENEFGLDVVRGSLVDLAEISPLVAVQIGGKATVEARGTGDFDVPRISGDLKIDDFSLGGFAAGDIERAKASFVPLAIELSEVELRKNQSVITSKKAVVDFDAGADVLVDAEIDTTQAPHLAIRDFFEVFEFDKDPRFASIAGTAIGTAKVRYALGGPEDRCGGGMLDVTARMGLSRPEVFGETFEKGVADVRFRYDDSVAGSEGMQIDVHSATLQDGAGSISAQATVRHGGVLRGTVVAAGVPLSKLEGFGSLRDYLDGELSAFGALSGSLDRLESDLDVSISPLRFGANKLPGSRLSVQIEPEKSPKVVIGQSQCGNDIGPPFSLAEYEKDLSSGLFRVNGQLFDGQVAISDVTVTRQKKQLVKGRLSLDKLDVGTILGALPSYALGAAPKALLSANIDVAQLYTDDLSSTQAKVELSAIDVMRGGVRAQLVKAAGPIVVERGAVAVPKLALKVADPSGLELGLSAQGKVMRVFSSSPELDAELAIDPVNLATLRGEVASIERIAGTLSGGVTMKGDLTAPTVNGFAKLRDGALGITDFPALEQISVDVAIGDGELRVTKASANVGAGTLDVTGRAPIVGFGLGAGNANITARGLKLPVGEGIDVIANADLDATIPASARTDGALPEVTGTVSVSSFTYRRPIALSLDLGELSRRIGRTEVSTVDPKGDFMRFVIKIVSPRPLVVDNDLADIRLEIQDPGIELSGTNQRYGAKGSLRLLPDSKLRLRNHEFDVREGYVRFDDPTRVKADIDLRATTELRRYAQAESAQDTSAGASSTATAGQWDVSVHAHGTTDNLKLDLSSDPQLDQNDIVLLLTMGMTRAEIDRGLATSLGETVGLEALSALTGADKAVKTVVPIIDYFHFGSSYSSRTGGTEPNVTVGKRLTDDLRASVTTTLTQRDVAASVEWRLKKGVSLQASYDNSNDIGTIIGNLGADLRWRLEFE